MVEKLHLLTNLLRQKKLRIATAESCTAGLVAKLLTDEAGSSAWFERGFVTYSNAAKLEMLAVKPTTLEKQGAVSEATVMEMASGALQHSHADVSLAISGIAGPDGGSVNKPVGTVWFAWAAGLDQHQQEKLCFSGDRHAIRQQAAAYAIQGMRDFLMTQE